MKPVDTEPPNLPPVSVLRVAKTGFIKSIHLHEDPQRALEIMIHTSWSNTIHNISFSAFYVHCWTAHQTCLFFHYAQNEISSMSMNATGDMIKSIELYNGIKTVPIYQ